MRPIVPLLFLALVAGSCDRQKQAAPQAPDPQAEAGPAKGVDRSHKGQVTPDTVFKDPDGEDIDLSEFRGVPVLVNLWATWCAPCVKELPTLNSLAKAHAADGKLGVVAVSQDMAPQGSVKAFLTSHKLDQLGAYHDSKMDLSTALGAQVLPSSVLYDSTGHEIWRYTGDLDWTGPEAQKLLAEAR